MNRLHSGLIIVVVSLCLIIPGMATARLELDESSLRSWADDVFGRALDDQRFSGLGLIAVQDGKVVATLTYGYAKWDERQAIDPAQTQFLIGSTTKTFTATAVAQLLDRGVIVSLDDPANRYLKRIQLPNWQGTEISLWDLLTHRAGFEDLGKSIAADEDIPVPISGAVIEDMMPRLIGPPDSMSVYCNFCTSLLGAVVEDLTGQTLNDYLGKNVFGPLGMDNTILQYSHLRTSDAGIAQVFYPNGDSEPLGHVGIHPFIAPAGNIYSTLDDMARFMIAHIDAGKTSDNPLMTPQTFQIMHTVKSRNHYAVAGIGMNFIVYDWNGERVLDHPGGWPGYGTSMTLFPDSNAGVFIGIFGASPPTDYWEVLANKLGLNDRLTRREPGAPGLPLIQFNLHDMVLSRLLGDFDYMPGGEHQFEMQDPKEFVGLYFNDRRNYTTASRLLDLHTGHSTRVETHPQGGLEINGRGPYRQVDRDVFLMSDAVGGEYAPYPLSYLYAFIRNSDDRITHATIHASIDPAARIPAWAAPEFAFSLLRLIAMIAISGFAVIFWTRGRAKSAGITITYVSLASVALAMAISFVNFVGPGRGNSAMNELALGRTGELLTLLIFTNLFAAFAVGACYWAAKLWLTRHWAAGVANQLFRLHMTLVALASIAAIPLLWLHGGIGFALP